MPVSVEHTTTARGFGLINFKDRNGEACSLQISSACGDEDNPLGYLWLGVDDAKPQIMKSDAQRMGLPLPPGEISGWMPYDVPKEVMFTTRMHPGGGSGAHADANAGAMAGNKDNHTKQMTHKYPVGTWLRFYQNGVLVIGVVEYLPKKESWELFCSYNTSLGRVSEEHVLEARLPCLEK